MKKLYAQSSNTFSFITYKMKLILLKTIEIKKSLFNDLIRNKSFTYWFQPRSNLHTKFEVSWSYCFGDIMNTRICFGTDLQTNWLVNWRPKKEFCFPMKPKFVQKCWEPDSLLCMCIRGVPKHRTFLSAPLPNTLYGKMKTR